MMHLAPLNTISSVLGAAAPASISPIVDTGGGFWFLPPSSTVADPVDWIFYFITWICVFFFVAIVVLMVWFMVKYRRTSEKAPTRKAATHNTPLEVTWTVIPLILVIFIFYVGLDGYVKLIQAPANAYEVNVTAQKWNWTFEHRNGATDTQYLRVPANRPVKLIMKSTDVLHSLYIPAFRVKQDVVPGRYSTLWFEATEPGTYQLFCTEYCGQKHSQMAALVEVYPEDEFERVIAADARWIDRYAQSELFKAGYRLFARCSSCHSLEKDGTNYVRMTGPSFWQTHDLWAAGEPRVMDDGEQVTIDEEYINNSILNPQGHIVATYDRVMPTFRGQLKPVEIDALVQFIKRLDEVVDEQGNLIISIDPVAAPDEEPVAINQR